MNDDPAPKLDEPKALTREQAAALLRKGKEKDNYIRIVTEATEAARPFMKKVKEAQNEASIYQFGLDFLYGGFESIQGFGISDVRIKHSQPDTQKKEGREQQKKMGNIMAKRDEAFQSATDAIAVSMNKHLPTIPPTDTDAKAEVELRNYKDFLFTNILSLLDYPPERVAAEAEKQWSSNPTNIKEGKLQKLLPEALAAISAASPKLQETAKELRRYERILNGKYHEQERAKQRATFENDRQSGKYANDPDGEMNEDIRISQAKPGELKISSEFMGKDKDGKDESKELEGREQRYADAEKLAQDAIIPILIKYGFTQKSELKQLGGQILKDAAFPKTIKEPAAGPGRTPAAQPQRTEAHNRSQ